MYMCIKNLYFNLICMELRKTRELFVVNIP